MTNTAFLGLGSNMGNRDSNILRAVNEIDKNKSCSVLKRSSIYETEPYGFHEQDNFYNCIIKIETDLNVNELFKLVKETEDRIGRKERFRWGPREIDIDIIFFNSDIIITDNIRVPHKGAAERDFVMVPLSEIESDYIHPELNKKISDICETITEKNIIRKI